MDGRGDPSVGGIQTDNGIKTGGNTGIKGIRNKQSGLDDEKKRKSQRKKDHNLSLNNSVSKSTEKTAAGPIMCLTFFARLCVCVCMCVRGICWLALSHKETH